MYVMDFESRECCASHGIKGPRCDEVSYINLLWFLCGGGLIKLLALLFSAGSREQRAARLQDRGGKKQELNFRRSNATKKNGIKPRQHMTKKINYAERQPENFYFPIAAGLIVPNGSYYVHMWCFKFKVDFIINFICFVHMYLRENHDMRT